MIGFGELPRLPVIGSVLDLPCPLCSATRKKPKLKCLRIWRPEPGWLTYHCVHCGEHGYAFKDGIERDIDWGLRQRLAAERQRRNQEARNERRRLAANSYGQGIAESPLIDAYFAGRGLEIPARARRQLRYDPACRFAEGVFGAILMPFRDMATYHFAGVHKIAVDAAGAGLRIAGKKLKKSQGAVAGAAMMWAREAEVLTVCEGLETAFAVAMGGDNEGSPIWALSGSSFLAAFAPGPGERVRRLIIAADHDEAGLKAARGCERNWESVAMVDTIWPDQPGEDFADRYQTAGR